MANEGQPHEWTFWTPSCTNVHLSMSVLHRVFVYCQQFCDPQQNQKPWSHLKAEPVIQSSRGEWLWPSHSTWLVDWRSAEPFLSEEPLNIAEVQLLMLFTLARSHVEKCSFTIQWFQLLAFYILKVMILSSFFTDGLIQIHAVYFPLIISSSSNIDFIDMALKSRP